jgi:hypothetical protein
MSERKSPFESATLFKVGTEKRGLDGFMWQIVETKTGVKRWQKVSPSNSVERKTKISKRSIDIKPSRKGRNYMIHDNGGRPFRVHIEGKHITVYKVPEDKMKELDDIFYELSETQQRKYYTEKILEFKNVKKIFIGHHPKQSDDSLSKSFSDGNSILLNIKGLEYVYIGWLIHAFTTSEPILQYYSEIGNNDVPYPVAVSKNYVYLMAENREIPKSVYPNHTDFAVKAYTYYYGHEGVFYPSGNNYMSIMKKNSQIFKDQSSPLRNYKILIERLD